jgi:uncharacterized membrane protein
LVTPGVLFLGIDIGCTIKAKRRMRMFRVLYFLLLDGFFAYMLIAYYEEPNGYVFLWLAIVIWLTWELIRAFKDWIGK